MATASAFSLKISDYGSSTVVPDDDVARMMYYLHCVTVGVGLDILQDDLVRYKHYYQLSPARIALVVKSALEFSPDEFIGKLIFRDDKGEVTGSSSNKFVSISAACNIISLQRDIIIAGKVQDVTKVMFFKSSWLEKYYIQPMTRIATVILDTKHCSHCEGEKGICLCTKCPRTSSSRCQPLFETFLGALLTGPSPPASRTPEPQAKPVKSSPGQHQCNCDGCGRGFFTCSRYKCTVCDDYDLCATCYKRDIHNMAHPFMQIDTPGAKPIHLLPRSKTITQTRSTKQLFRKGDSVVLVKLSKFWMNGKKGTVSSVDQANGAAQVRVEEKTFKVKFENLQEEIEELE